MSRQVGALVAGLLVALVMVPAQAQQPPSTASPQSPDQSPGQPSLGIRLLEAPADRVDDPRARSYIVDHLPAGETIERDIEVSNSSDEPLAVELYAVGAEVRDGAFVPAEGREQNELARWVTMSPAALTVEPGTRSPATVTIAVPADAVPGERYALALVEHRADAGGGIVLSSRVGIRIYLSVGPGPEPPSDFVIERVDGARGPDGAPEVTATVHNQGGRALDLTGTLELRDGPGGLAAGPFPAQVASLLPGARATLVVPLDPQVPDGPWEARLVLRSGTVEREALGTLDFSVGTDAWSPGGRGGRGTGWPVLVAVGTLLAVLALLAWSMWLRVRERAAPLHSLG